MEIDFTRFLNGNPAMLEIWSDALDRIEKKEKLSPVQTVVVREWITRASAWEMKLELEAQRKMLSDEKYAEMATLREMLDKMEDYR